MQMNEAVQSCITSITFPDNLNDYYEGLLKSEEIYGEKQNDIESLICFDPNRYEAWTAPKWLTSGDIMFFYLTKSFKLRALKLIKVSPRELQPYIKKAIDLANIYSGTIFACADILDSSFYDEAIFPNIKSKVFAPLSNVHIFKRPIPLEDFNDFIKIRRGAITPVFGASFDDLIRAISLRNPLPETLQNRKSEKGFYGINMSNWINISCIESKKILNEHQLREFFIDYFIEYIKDEGSKVLKECDCFRNGSITGAADYFIKINKKWIPIEAKLNGQAEKNLFKQLDKYINIDYFLNGNKKIDSKYMPLCLLIDQSGLYIANHECFIECDFDQPYLRRKNITQEGLKSIKNELSSIIMKYCSKGN